MHYRERGNAEGNFAIAVRENSDITRVDGDDKPVIGYLPRELNKAHCGTFYFTEVVEYEVTERWQHSPLEQGGLEIPCRVTLCGRKKM